jgi:hypothetical protein
MRSFDTPRERQAPVSFDGVTLEGDFVTHFFDQVTLLVAVKEQCDGCRDFVHSALDEFADIAVVIVSATAEGREEWSGAVHDVIVAPDILRELDIRWPPFYVLIDPAVERVVTEGVVFGPSQVASEVATFVHR